MDKEARYAVVGGFVIAVVILMAIAFAWLIHAFERETVREFNVIYSGSIAGLQEGSQVRFRGVPVGRVTQIRLDSEQYGRILVTISIDPSTPVRADTVAAIAPQGITGVATIELEGGTADGPETTQTADGLPVIQGRQSTLEQVFESTPDLLAEAVTVSRQLTVLLSNDNLERFNALISNLVTISDVLAHDEEGLRTLIGQAQSTAFEIEQLTKNANQTLLKTGDEVSALSVAALISLEKADGAAETVQTSAQRLNRLIGQIDEPLVDFSNGGLYRLDRLIGEMRQLTAAMSRIALEFERDPAGYLLRGSGRGFEPE